MVTINDYTIQVKMTPTMWKNFRDQTKYSVDEDEMLPFENDLTEQIQKQIMQQKGMELK